MNKVGINNLERVEFSGVRATFYNGGDLMTIRFKSERHDPDGVRPGSTFSEFATAINGCPFFVFKFDSTNKDSVIWYATRGVINVNIVDFSVGHEAIKKAVEEILKKWAPIWETTRKEKADNEEKERKAEEAKKYEPLYMEVIHFSETPAL